MPLRPHQLLDLANSYFSGNAHVSDALDGSRPGLMAMLKIINERPEKRTITESEALTAEDEGRIIEVAPDGGGTVTIELPAGFAEGFFAQIQQVAAGTVILEAGAGATANAFNDPVTIELGGVWASVGVQVRDEDTWLVTGQLV